MTVNHEVMCLFLSKVRISPALLVKLIDAINLSFENCSMIILKCSIIIINYIFILFNEMLTDDRLLVATETNLESPLG